MATTTRRARTSRSRAVIAAGLLAAAAVASMPATAATDPVVVATSFDNGWSHGRSVVVQFDQDIRGCGTASAPEVCATAGDVVVLDVGGTEWAGTVSSAGSQSFMLHDVLIWAPDLDGKIDENGLPIHALPQGEYEMWVYAKGRTSGGEYQTPDAAPLTFKVDNTAPRAPEFASPSFTTPNVGTASITGVFSDRGTGAFRSGVSHVVLHFFNAADPLSYGLEPVHTPVATIPAAPQAKEITSLRRAVAASPCGLGIEICVGADAFGNPIPVHEAYFSLDRDLPPGLWTIKAIAYDLAGNQSNEASVTFVNLGLVDTPDPGDE